MRVSLPFEKADPRCEKNLSFSMTGWCLKPSTSKRETSRERDLQERFGVRSLEVLPTDVSILQITSEMVAGLPSNRASNSLTEHEENTKASKIEQRFCQFGTKHAWRNLIEKINGSSREGDETNRKRSAVRALMRKEHQRWPMHSDTREDQHSMC
jgi:hypothetical protein